MSTLLSPAEVDKFQSLISTYQPNHSVLRDFQASNFAVIAGPAGAGKDTLRNALLDKFSQIYISILSTTTRPKRQGEREGMDYYFRSPAEVEIGLKRREFFQAQLVHNQQVSCMHVDEIKKLENNQTGLSILLVQTESQLGKIKPDIKTIFLIPPTLDVLRERMQAERVLAPDEVARRLFAARKEMKIALERIDYFCLVSDDLSELVSLADNFLQHGTKQLAADQRARRIIQNVLDQL